MVSLKLLLEYLQLYLLVLGYCKEYTKVWDKVVFSMNIALIIVISCGSIIHIIVLLSG